MKKPRRITIRKNNQGYAEIDNIYFGDPSAHAFIIDGTAKDCRRLAEWLWHAAAYLDGIDKPKKVKKK